MHLISLPRVVIRSSEVTAGRWYCHTLLRNCPYSVLRKQCTQKRHPQLTLPLSQPGQAPAGPDHFCFPPGPVGANQEVRLLSQCVCEALPCGWKGECLHRSFWSTAAEVPRAVPSLSMSLLMAAVSLPQSRGSVQSEDGWRPQGTGALLCAGLGQLHFIMVFKILK